MTHDPKLTVSEERLRLWAERALAGICPSCRAELDLLAQVEPGLWIRQAANDPMMAELIYAGKAISRARWSWLNGEEDPGPGDVVLG